MGGGGGGGGGGLGEEGTSLGERRVLSWVTERGGYFLGREEGTSLGGTERWI